LPKAFTARQLHLGAVGYNTLYLHKATRSAMTYHQATRRTKS